MEYLIIIIALVIGIQIYFALAKKYNIIDKPNHRSSHTKITLRGGGIIFPLAYLLFMGHEVLFNQYPFYLSYVPSPNFWIFGIGLLLICGISFIDDVIALSSKIRLIFHFAAVTLLLYFLNIFQLFPWWTVPLCYFLIIGILNAYNFMDGINGISGLYSMVLLGSLWFVNDKLVEFVISDFIIFPVLAAGAFLYFNFRKQAKCFLGDIGSMGIAFWILALLGLLIIKIGEMKYLLFLTVYGIDVIATLLERIKLKENIFEAHRRHLYQLFANDLKISHLAVSAIYSICQVLINIFVIFSTLPDALIFAVVLVPLVAVYFYTKFTMKKSIQGNLR